MRRTAIAAAVVALAAAGCAADPPAGTVGIRVTSSCSTGSPTASGMVVGPGLVLTAAHPLRGAREIVVRRDGVDVPAEIVAFDPEMDLAYLAIAGPTAAPMPIDSDHVDPGDPATAWVVRAGQPVAVRATVQRRVRINTEDIYVDGETTRPGFELMADIEPGDSGAAVVVDGTLAAVVWAKSRRATGRAWAIDPDRGGGLIDEQLRTGRLGDDVSLVRCR